MNTILLPITPENVKFIGKILQYEFFERESLVPRRDVEFVEIEHNVKTETITFYAEKIVCGYWIVTLVYLESNSMTHPNQLIFTLPDGMVIKCNDTEDLFDWELVRKENT